MKKKYPLLISLQHCSNKLPVEVQKNIILSQSEIDHYLDIGSQELYSLEDFHVFLAQYSRLYCDLNRAPDHDSTPKDRGGVILETTYWGGKIYKKTLSKVEKKERINEHKRYFNALKKYIQKHNIQFLISAHTMDHHQLKARKSLREHKEDICLSNNYFATCSAQKLDQLKLLLGKEGYTVTINDPFKGGYLLNYFCHRETLPGIQIEFNFTLIGNAKKTKINHRPKTIARASDARHGNCRGAAKRKKAQADGKNQCSAE